MLLLSVFFLYAFLFCSAVDHLVNTASLGHTFYFEEATDTSVFPILMVKYYSIKRISLTQLAKYCSFQKSGDNLLTFILLKNLISN